MAIPINRKLKNLFEELSNSQFIESHIVPFNIVDHDICFKDCKKVKFFILHVKLFPQVSELTPKLMLDSGVQGKVFALETKNCVQNIRQDLLDFKPGT